MALRSFPGGRTSELAKFQCDVAPDFAAAGTGELVQWERQGLELFYNNGFTPWCRVTAGLQVAQPGSSILDTTVLPATRLKIDFLRNRSSLDGLCKVTRSRSIYATGSNTTFGIQVNSRRTGDD